MYYIPQLLTNRYLRHGISTVNEGNMSFSFGEKADVIKSRTEFLINVRIPVERSVFLEVQHGTKIIEGKESNAGTGFYSEATALKADAIVTREKNLAIIILTADCIPVILFDRANEILVLVHVSRHNSKLAFLQIVVNYLKREYGTNIQELKAFFGPSIKKESYVLPQFPKGYDLTGESQNQLILKGVRRENITIDPMDTAANEEFFSHYRDSRNKISEGRFATVAMLT